MKILFWAVDCQKDFLNKDGKLYVEGAESIKPNLKKLTDLAVNYNLTVVNTLDWHDANDEELSDNPDFINTFPQHCMANKKGSELIEETTPIDGLFSFYENKRNVSIKKNKFDVFTGNLNTDNILEALNPDLIIIYGVATNVCVNFAVLGLVARGYKVVVVKDAIKELPQIDVNAVYEGWEGEGVIFETTDNIENAFCIKE